MKTIDGVRFAGTVRVGKKCKWEDIKAGEIFARRGCWQILLKLDGLDAMYLANNYFDEGKENYLIGHSGNYRDIAIIHKLPKSFQKNFVGYGK